MFSNGPPALPAALFSLVLATLVLGCGWYFDRMAEPQEPARNTAATAQWVESVKTALLQVGTRNDNARQTGR